MSDDLKKEAERQYLQHFRFWFLAVIILLVVTAAMAVARYQQTGDGARTNNNAPRERVYDYADVLTDEEEENLREYIAQKEEKYHADFVIMTFSQKVTGQEAMQNGYSSTSWETNMMNIADDFWDENGYGYNKDFEGDGSILVDNRYPERGEGGEWLSTSGKVERALGTWDVEEVLYAVDDYYDSNPYKAYKAYIDKVCYYLDDGAGQLFGSGTGCLAAVVVALVATLIYVAYHLGKNKAKDTVAVNAYVAGGKPEMRDSRDDFIRKSVVKRRIETSSGSGRSGGGGHHVSGGGASHGGGGHRH